MQVIYTAPNRAHHYIYAQALYKANALAAFVSGFSRFSPRANEIEVGNNLHRIDSLQNVYLAALRYRFPDAICHELAYRAKIQQDQACSRFLSKANAFLFYNGSGLDTLNKAKKKGIITIVEVVNSHVDYQETILRNEYQELGLKWQPFHKKEKKRRMLEYERADYILLPSEFVKKSFLLHGFPKEKLLKVPYGFNQLSLNSNKNKHAQKAFTVLYVGSISVRKGLCDLIEAFKKMPIKDKKLVITGPMTSPTGFESISLSPDIIFTGVLKGKDLHTVYASADVFCLPSVEEGFGLVLGEALSFGLPIIATENSGASDIFTNGQEGFIVPVKSSEAILEKLILLTNNKEVFIRMKNAAIKRTSSLCGWQKTQNQLVETVRGLCE